MAGGGPVRRPRAPAASNWLVFAVVALATAAAALGGIVFGLGGARLGAIYTIGIAGLFLVMMPVGLLAWATWLSATLVAGTLQYFGIATSYAPWLPYGFAAALLLRQPFESYRLRLETLRVRHREPKRASASMIALGLFTLACAVSAAVNLSPFGQLIVFAKNVFVVWSLAIVVAWGCLNEVTVKRLWQSLLIVLAIQVPVSLVQLLVFVPRRAANGGQFDAVAGTFGGDPGKGGSNSTVVFFAIAAAMLAIAMYRNGLLRRRWMVLACLSALLVTGIGEVKAAFVFIPVAIFVLYAEELLRRPKLLFQAVVSVVVLVGGLFAVYQTYQWSSMRQYGTAGDSVHASVDYIVNPRNIDWTDGEVGRVAALALWYNDFRTDFSHRLIGHGPGASRSESTVGATGEVGKRFFPLRVASTSLALLLWDVGVVGLLAYIGLILAGVIDATRAIRAAPKGSLEEAIARTARVVIVLTFAFLPYNRYSMDQAPYQVLLFLSIGSVVWILRRHGRPSGRRFVAPLAGGVGRGHA